MSSEKQTPKGGSKRNLIVGATPVENKREGVEGDGRNFRFCDPGNKERRKGGWGRKSLAVQHNSKIGSARPKRSPEPKEADAGIGGLLGTGLCSSPCCWLPGWGQPRRSRSCSVRMRRWIQGDSGWGCQYMMLPQQEIPLVHFHSLHICSLTGQPWEMHSSSLNLSLSICKMG